MLLVGPSLDHGIVTSTVLSSTSLVHGSTSIFAAQLNEYSFFCQSEVCYVYGRRRTTCLRFERFKYAITRRVGIILVFFAQYFCTPENFSSPLTVIKCLYLIKKATTSIIEVSAIMIWSRIVVFYPALGSEPSQTELFTQYSIEFDANHISAKTRSMSRIWSL